MAYVARFKYDLFISYAHVDDQGDEKWVSRFVDELKQALQHRHGIDPRQLGVYFDRKDLGGNHSLDQLLSSASSSAVFIPILSPSYIARQWTLDEFHFFCEKAAGSDRIFCIEILPLDKEDKYPLPARQLARTPFWVDTNVGIPVTLHRSMDLQNYFLRIQKLAEQVGRQLLVLTKGDGADAGRGAQHQDPAPSSPAGSVLLAQVPSVLEGEHYLVSSHLAQFGHSVLPEGGYPQGRAAFSAAFKADLAKSAVFVQLLSERPARRPPDLPEGYDRFQYEAALAEARTRPVHRPLQLACWRHPELDVSSVADSGHKMLLEEQHVRPVGLEEFKREVTRLAEQARGLGLAASHGEQHQRNEITVFINAERSDMEIARKLYAELLDNSFQAIIPDYDDPGRTARKIRKELEQAIRTCDAFLLIYGKSGRAWVREQKLEYSKRKRGGTHRPIEVLGPPPEDKPDVGVGLPGLRRIDFRAGVAPEAMQLLLDELRQ